MGSFWHTPKHLKAIESDCEIIKKESNQQQVNQLMEIKFLMSIETKSGETFMEILDCSCGPLENPQTPNLNQDYNLHHVKAMPACINKHVFAFLR